MTRIDNAPKISLGGLGGRPGRSGGVLVGSAMRQTGREVAGLANVFARAAVDFQKRDNIREVNQAKLEYEAFKNDLLFGADGITHRRGNDAKGATEEASRVLADYLAEKNKVASNHVVRDALQSDLGLDIEHVQGYVSRHEAQSLEKARQSDAGALLNQTRRNNVNQFRTRLLPSGLGGSDDEFITTTDQYSEWIHTQNPDMGDEAIAITTRAMMAEDAQQAVFATLDQNGPNGRQEAENLVAMYEDHWTPAQRETVTKRIRNEVNFGLINQAVAGVGMAGGAGISEKDFIEGSVSEFTRRSEEEFGVEPDKAEIMFAEDRASRAYQIHKRDAARQESERRESGLSTVYEAIENNDLAAATMLIDRQQQVAIRNNDPKMYEQLQQIESNLKATGSIHPKKMTERGNELFLTSSADYEKDEVMAAAAYMPAATWRSWTGDYTSQGEDEPEHPSHSSLKQAVEKSAVRRTGNTPSKEEITLGTVELDRLSARYASQHGGEKPSTLELQEMADSLAYSLDDTLFDEGEATGTLGEFLLNPEKLSPEDKQDSLVLQTAHSALRSDPQLRKLVRQDLGISGGDITMQQLIDHPVLTARVLEYALATDTKLLVNGQPSLFTARDQINASEGN